MWRLFHLRGAWVLSLFALVAVPPVAAQRPKVEVFSVDRGLPSAAIADLAQDATGRLWILSRGGVTVYDGQTFRTVSGTGGLPSTPMAAIDADSRGEVWVVAKSRARVFHREGAAWTMLPEPPPSDFPAGRVTVLEVVDGSRGPAPVVGTKSAGLWAWDDDGWRHYGEAEGLPSADVTEIVALEHGVAVATRGGLCRLAGRKLGCPLAADARLTEPIYGLATEKAAPSRLWVLGKTWLGYLDDGRFTLVSDAFDLGSRGVQFTGAVAVDEAGGVYFGSPAYTFFFDPADRTIEVLGLQQGMPTEGTTTLLVDRELHVWVGSLRGLTKIESRRFLSYDQRSGFLESEVSAIAEPVPGLLVLGHNTGLTLFDVARRRTETLALTAHSPDHPDSFRVLDVAVDRRGEVWLAAQNLGLVRLSWPATPASWSVVPLPDAISAVFAVEVDAEGTLWVATRDVLFSRLGGELVPVAGVPRADYFRWLATDPAGRLFVGTKQGLLWREGNVWRWARSGGKESDDVFTVCMATLDRTFAGTVFAGTSAGLYELRGAELIAVARGGLALTRPVYLIVEDRQGRLWFGTDDGVFLWNGHQLRQLTVRHGLAGREANRGAGLVDARGRVWLGTDQGLSVYREDYDRPPSAPPIVEVSAIEAAGERRPADVGLTLAHHQSTLTFHLGTITFSRAERPLHRYRLEGFDDGWQPPAPLSGTEVRYTNLPPGTYRFRITAGWPGGPWSAEAATAAIVIARPLWRQAWFLGLTIAAVAIALLGGHGLRTRSIRRRNAELEAFNARLNASIGERQRLIAELERKNAELERFTYTVSHDLKSPLVTVQGFAGLLEKDIGGDDPDRVREDVAEIRKAVDRMGRLLNELLDLSRVGRVVRLAPDVDLAELAQVAVAGAQRDGRQVEVRIAPGLPVVCGDRVRLLEVLQNLTENAVKYMGGQPQPRIEIGTRRDGGELVIYVADNGAGIEPRYHEKIFGLFERLDQQTEGTGVGLALVKRIIEYHGGRIWVESEGPGRGAAFCFTLGTISEVDDAV